MTDEAAYPFAASVWQYRKAGWTGAQPIGRRPVEKSPPFKGYTGWTGVDPSGADVQTWCDGPEAAFNIGLHLPPGVFVLDQDVYGEKHGDVALRELQATLSPLPPTWTSTARGKDSGSRQFFYRATLPPGRVWKDHPVPAVDALHVGHRYAVVWPSKHPTAGTYYWYDHDGELYEGVPAFTDLAMLPADHVLAYSKEGEPLEGGSSSYEEARAVIEKFRHAPACPRVTRTLREELDRINSAASESLHAPGPLYKLTAYGLEGHAGVREALSEHQQAYVAARVKHRGDAAGSAGADWWRQVCGAVGKKLVASGGEVRQECGCADTPVSAPPAPAPTAGSPFAAPSDHLFDDGPQGPQGPQQGSAEVNSAGQSVAPTTVDPVQALLDEMLSPSQVANRKPPTPLIRGLLNLDSESWIIGAPGSKKSFVAMDMAAHVARGMPWQGLKVNQARVVMIVAEGAGGMGARIRAWEKTYGPMGSEVFILPRPVQAGDAKAWDVLVKGCARLEPGLVVVDTQARVTVGLEENSATDMGVYVGAVSAIREATAACVFTVHHTGRAGGDARGSSAIDGAQHTELKVMAEGLTGTLRTEKQKDMEMMPDLRLRFTVVDLGVSEDGDPLSSLVLAPLAQGFEAAAGEMEVEEWEVNHGPAQVQVLKVLLEQGAAVGLTKAEARIAVVNRFYGGDPKKLTKQTWFTAWSRTLMKTAPDGSPVVVKVGGARFAVDEMALRTVKDTA